MAVFTVIPDSDVDPDSPFTTGLATAYRENLIAAFEGASGAPTLANNYLTPDMMPAHLTGSYKIGETETGLADVTGTTLVKQETKIIKQAGTLNVRIGGARDGAFNSGYLQIYVNGVAEGVLRLANSTTTIYWEEDIVVAVDDLVQLYVRSATAGQTKTTWRLEFLVDSASILQAAVDPTSV